MFSEKLFENYFHEVKIFFQILVSKMCRPVSGKIIAYEEFLGSYGFNILTQKYVSMFQMNDSRFDNLVLKTK